MSRKPAATNGLSWQPKCPVDPEHGRLIDYPTGFFCPHSGHNHDEYAPWFTAEQVGAYDARRPA